MNDMAELFARDPLKHTRESIDEIIIKVVIDRLIYDPETGVFTWRNGVRAGKRAGSVMKIGYRAIALTINEKKVDFYEHRLAWLIVYGKWPDGIIDHKDRIKDNNKFINLRDTTHSENHLNSGKITKGVTWLERNQKWMAQSRGRYIGSFSTRFEAEEAYRVYIEETQNVRYG